MNFHSFLISRSTFLTISLLKMGLNRVEAADVIAIRVHFSHIPSPIKNTIHFPHLRATFGKYDPLSAFTCHF
jgi:hypothetical protein